MPRPARCLSNADACCISTNARDGTWRYGNGVWVGGSDRPSFIGSTRRQVLMLRLSLGSTTKIPCARLVQMDHRSCRLRILDRSALDSLAGLSRIRSKISSCWFRLSQGGGHPRSKMCSCDCSLRRPHSQQPADISGQLLWSGPGLIRAMDPEVHQYLIGTPTRLIAAVSANELRLSHRLW